MKGDLTFELTDLELGHEQHKRLYQCPVCGDQFSHTDTASDHVESAHPLAYSELRGGEIQVGRLRETELDLVDWCANLVRAGRRQDR